MQAREAADAAAQNLDRQQAQFDALLADPSAAPGDVERAAADVAEASAQWAAAQIAARAARNEAAAARKAFGDRQDEADATTVGLGALQREYVEAKAAAQASVDSGEESAAALWQGIADGAEERGRIAQARMARERQQIVDRWVEHAEQDARRLSVASGHATAADRSTLIRQERLLGSHEALPMPVPPTHAAAEAARARTAAGNGASADAEVVRAAEEHEAWGDVAGAVRATVDRAGKPVRHVSLHRFDAEGRLVTATVSVESQATGGRFPLSRDATSNDLMRALVGRGGDAMAAADDYATYKARTGQGRAEFDRAVRAKRTLEALWGREGAERVVARMHPGFARAQASV